MNKLIFFAAFSLFFQFSIAQTTTSNYWVFLKDKKNSPYSINTPSAYLSEKAIERRLKQHISIGVNDLPVNPSYINAIRSLSVNVVNESKWFNAITVSISDTNELKKIRSLSFVKNIIRLSVSVLNKVSSKSDLENKTNYVPAMITKNLGTGDTLDYGPSLDQARQIVVDCLHNAGYMGQGMTIAYMDAGFYKVDSLPAFDSIRANGQILGTRDFVNGGTNVYDDISAAHGTNTLSCIGGNLPGRIVGTAPKAKFWLFRTENVYSESWQEEVNWAVAAEFADSVGVDIITSSLGYSINMTDSLQNHTFSEMDGNTTIITKAADLAASKGIFVTSSAGNSGGPPWYKITAPADADSILTVGAIDSARNLAPFSSRGLTYDGRIKPNTVAKGVQSIVASQEGGIVAENGTSFSAPITAGAVACLWQANPGKTNMELLYAIQQSATQHLAPDSLVGYGIPNFCLANALLTGIHEQEMANDENLIVYPNPFNTNFDVVFYSEKKQIVEFELLDMTGRKLFTEEKNLSANSKSIFNSKDMGILSNGIYVIRIVTSDKIYFKKLIKK